LKREFKVERGRKGGTIAITEISPTVTEHGKRGRKNEKNEKEETS